MYSQIDAVEIAKTTADAEALKDRQRYVPFFSTAEQYATEHGLIIGGKSATELLLGERPGRDSFRYEFYSERAGKHARGLALALCDAHPVLAHYTEMRPRVPGFEFSIYVDGRELFYIRALPGAVAVPSLRPANFATDLQLKCMGPEIQLMETYAALADPSRTSEWTHLLEVEFALRRVLLKEVREKIGVTTKTAAATGGNRSCPEASARARIIAVLVRDYVDQPGRVIVGPLAYSRGTASVRLQIVSQNPLEHEEKEIRRLLKENGEAGDIQGSRDSPKIPGDARICRLTMYCHNNRGRREAFMDVFNVGEHELVPFVEGNDYAQGDIYPIGLRRAERQAGRQAERQTGRQRRSRDRPRDGSRSLLLLGRHTRLGTPFVLMRFRLIDLWTLQLLLRYGAISPEYARRILHEIVDGFEAVVAGYLKLLQRLTVEEADHVAPLLFPTQADSYIGHYESPPIAKKRWTDALRRERTARGPGARKYQPPFFPCARTTEAQKK